MVLITTIRVRWFTHSYYRIRLRIGRTGAAALYGAPFARRIIGLGEFLPIGAENTLAGAIFFGAGRLPDRILKYIIYNLRLPLVLTQGDFRVFPKGWESFI